MQASHETPTLLVISHYSQIVYQRGRYTERNCTIMHDLFAQKIVRVLIVVFQNFTRESYL